MAYPAQRSRIAKEMDNLQGGKKQRLHYGQGEVLEKYADPIQQSLLGDTGKERPKMLGRPMGWKKGTYSRRQGEGEFLKSRAGLWGGKEEADLSSHMWEGEKTLRVTTWAVTFETAKLKFIGDV